MKRIIHKLSLIICVLMCLSGCASNEVISETVTETLNEETTAITNAVAAGAETVANELTLPEGTEPVYGTAVKDGVYNIKVDSSSSMFNVESCELTAKNGEMTAVMTMGGKGYLYVFMGKGENASEDKYISFAENEKGEHTFTVPVEALDMAIDCAAFSKKKEQWYDRTLIFRADSLPAEAFADGYFKTIDDLGLADGDYTVNVTLEGGSGKASVNSPARLTVTDGKASAEIIWSSSNYDYMVVEGERYDCINTEGNSAFVIPVTRFDSKMPVKANTTAMSTPHEIDYTLYFDSASIS